MTDHVLISRAELDDLVQAVRHYQRATLDDSGFWGQHEARDVTRKISKHNPMALLWLTLWWGRNHQHLQPGDSAQWSEPHVDEFHPCEVLEPHTYGAIVLDDFGAEWRPWPQVHRLDRLHSEPTFDVANLGAIREHMGLPRDLSAEPPAGAPLYLARRLAAVPDGKT